MLQALYGKNQAAIIQQSSLINKFLISVYKGYFNCIHRGYI